jgi:formate hydrogenlyase subunit 3/multisubunit Na+/H+ antiporter MnhD subunit
VTGAFIWIILPLLVSFFLIIMRKHYWLSSWLQIAVSFILALLAVISTTDPINRGALQVIEFSPVFNILGRSLVIDSNLRILAFIFYIFLGFWSLALHLFKVQSRVVPLGLTFFAFAISSLAVEPFLYSALLIEIAVIVSVIMVADTKAESKKGVLRYLVYFSFGVPFVLLAGWYLAGGEITPVNEGQLIQATLLLGLGFVFWLGVFPFQSWIPLIGDENRPTESMLLLIMMPVVIIMLLLKYLNGFVWLREFQLVFQGLRIFGLIMTLTGSFWALFEQNIRRLISYLMIVSTGLMLLSIGLDQPTGVYLSAYLIFIRLNAFFVLTWTLFILQRENVEFSFDSFRALFFRSPLLGLSSLIAFFSIVGMPLTVGFPVMQSLYAFLSAANRWLIISAIFSSGGISIVYIRLSFLIFSQNREMDLLQISTTTIEKVFLILLVLFLISAGLFPNIFLSGFEGAVSGFEFLVK